MFVEVEPGIQVHVQDVGPADGPVVVLLAAFGYGHRAWDRQVAALAADHRTLAIDLRGHGLSSKPADGYDCTTVAADVRAVLDHLEVQDTTVVGWSYGGGIAVRAAAQDASRVGRLVLVAPHGPYPMAHPSNPEGFTEQAVDEMIQGTYAAPEEFRWAAVAMMPRVPFSNAVQLDLFAQTGQLPPWASHAALAEMAVADFRDDARALDLPTLIVAGRHDAVAPIARMEVYRDLIRGSRLEVFEESAHCPTFEEPGAFDVALRAFIGSRSRSGAGV